MAEPAPTPTPEPNPNPWYHGKADAETIGYLQARGWDKDPVHAALEAGKAHREAEKFIGAPSSELIRLPRNMNDPEAMKPVFQRLGAPKDAKDYDFTNVKTHDNKAPSEAFLDVMRQTAARLNLPKDSAPLLAQAVLKQREGEESAALAERTAQVNEDKAALEKEWGKDRVAHMLAAQKAAEALKVSPEAVNALEGQIGYKAVMEMFRNIAAKIGEDKFITNDKGGGPNLLTKEMAVSKKAELMADTDWKNRYLKNGMGSPEWKEMQAIDKIILGIV